MTKELTAPPTYDSQILSNAGQVGAEMKALIQTLPEADDDAYVRIVESIIHAKDVSELDAPWTAAKIEAYVDSPLRVLSIHRMPSDFNDGLGAYLVIKATKPGDGEVITMSSGSVSIVAQLAKAHALGALPLLCIVRKARKPSANGYFPMHLEIVRAQ